MKRRLWTVLSVMLLVVTIGCADRKTEIEPVRLGRLNDADATTVRDVDLETVSEVDLVEQLHQVRADYKRLLEVLRAWYLQHGYYDKSEWARKELASVNLVQTYPYLTVTEVVQVPEQGATDEMVEANELYDRAKKLFDEGRILPGVNDKTKLKQALEMFKDIVKKYPTSTRAPNAAFYAAEILKEHFSENLQAVEYYKLALKLDPEIDKPVRFQMAVVYDFRLHDRAAALELYHRVLDEEADIDKTNTWFASNRIRQLMKAETPEAAEPAPATRPAE